MISRCESNGFCIVGNRCMYDGQLIPSPPRFNKNHTNLTTIDDKVYLNGYEWFPEKQKWVRTPKAIWHFISNALW